MKKTLFSLIFAICLIVALIPVMASADGEVANLAIADQTVTVNGTQTLLFTTDASTGFLTATTDTNAYNVKVALEGGEAKIWLKGATLKNSDTYAAIEVLADTTASALRIIVETDSTIIATTKNAFSDGKLVPCVIEGTGKLTVEAEKTAFNMYQQSLTFKDLEVVVRVNTTASSQHCIGGRPDLVTFDGCNAVLEATGTCSVYYSGNTDSSVNLRGIQIINGADVTMESVKGTTIYGANPNSKLLVDGSNLTLSLSDGSGSKYCLNWTNKNVEFKNSTVEISSDYRVAGAFIPTLTYTDNNYVALFDYFDSMGGSESERVYEGIDYVNLNNGKHFYVAPAYTVKVNGGGTASLEKALENAQVTLTAPAVDGKTFKNWTVDDGFAAVEFADATKAETTFTMPAANVSVTANYEAIPDPNIAKIKFINVAGENVQITVGNSTGAQYFHTDANGRLITEGNTATETDYNVKVLIEGEDAVVYLKGATLKDNATYRVFNILQTSTVSNLRIVVEGNNTIIAAEKGVIYNQAVPLVFEGTGKLTLQAAKDALYMDKTDGLPITFKNLELDATLTGNAKLITGRTLKVTFDGCTARINTESKSAFFISNKTIAAEGILVTNDANVTITSTDGQPIYSENPNAKIVVNSGSLSIAATGKSSTGEAYPAVRLDSGIIEVNGGTLELSSLGKSAYCGDVTKQIVPVLTAYANCVAVAGDDAATATAYDGSDLVNFKYFKVCPATVSEEPDHTHVTTLVKGKAPSCTAAGEKDYYKCDCGKYFEDEAATKEIADVNTWKVIKATGHADSNKDGKCDTCKAAQTSDSSFIALWITVLTLSAMGVCVTFVYNKKMRATK